MILVFSDDQFRFFGASGVKPSGYNGRCDTLWTRSSLSVEQDVAGSTPASHP